MAAAKYDIDIEQGATWRKTFRLLKSNNFAKDLTGYTAKAQFRAKASSEDILAELDVKFVSPRKCGKIVLSLTPEETAAFTFYTAVWDLFLTSPNGVHSKLLKGTVTVYETVTKE